MSPDRAKQLYGEKYDAMVAKFPEMSSIYNKVNKKAALKQKDIEGMMEEAFIDYATDLSPSYDPSLNEIRKNKIHKFKALAEMINQCL
jgi:hemoglobin-like flavoprotein